jgi:hypothetical protein
MDFVIWLALSGGLFAVMTFIHFFVDWIFQSHAEAMAKHNNAMPRARHCAIYAVGFVPLLLAFIWVGALTPIQLVISIAILFISHFYLDTYHGVYLWAKYIRRPPEMNCEDKKLGFVQFVQTTLGKILMIAIDQISHLSFLWIIVYFVMRHLIK